MSKTFFTSDTHFHHAAIIAHGGRPFSSVGEMDEELIRRWNATVGKKDRVYHLGDVGHFEHVPADVLERLNGRKILILGNHDNASAREYLRYFEDVQATRIVRTGMPPGHCGAMLLSHVPIAQSSIPGFAVNVHGHLHQRVMSRGPYLSVCVERTDYTPIEFNALRDMACEVWERQFSEAAEDPEGR